MGQDINIPMSDLERLNTSLKNIVDEFEHAGSRSNAHMIFDAMASTVAWVVDEPVPAP